MPAEPPPELSKGSAAHAASSGGRLPPPSAREIDAAERRLDSPTPLTMRLLGVVCLATVLPWLAAKVACNERDSPVRQPHDLATDVVVKTAKSTALELAQRAASGRYREAAELAKADVAKELLDAETRCQTEPAPCEKRRAQAEHVFTRVVIASRGPIEATVRTESVGGSDAPERFAMRLAQEDGRWFVVQKSPLAGEIDAPVAPEEMVSPVAIRPVPGQPPMSIAAPGSNPHGGSD